MLRYDVADCRNWLTPGAAPPDGWPAAIGLEDPPAATARLQRLVRDDRERNALAELLPAVLSGLEAAHAPDQALLHFERFLEAVDDRLLLFARLADNPRQTEILLRLFVNSQFLTEILLRNPNFLERLSHHQRVAEVKSPPQYQAEAEAAAGPGPVPRQLDALRRYQQWEILRLAACDTFHLMDLRTITQQLSRLADALVQQCLTLIAAELRLSLGEFAVLGFGKLGGEELNYSSDIDLVFVARSAPEQHWKLAQQLIGALHEATDCGFLYRVDMRLRPWGQSGPLVTTVDAYVDYLERHGRPWERQALLKARTIAGSADVGDELLQRLEPLVFGLPGDVVRTGIRASLDALRPRHATRAQLEAEVKSGPGGIRDIEFLTQCLQLAYGREWPSLRSRSTLDALIRLADADLILPGEYQHLTSAYVFQRAVEHSLQLTHNRQRYTLPQHPRELEYLAGRLDYESAAHFLTHYREHRRVVQDIVARRLAGAEPAVAAARPAAESDAQRHFGAAAESYGDAFTPEQAARHARLLERLGTAQLAVTEARPLTDDRWELTVAGFDQLGDLALMCGLLFVRGLDIESGFVFTGADVGGPTAAPSPGRRRKFVNVFLVRPTAAVDGTLWDRYDADLRYLLQLAAAGRMAEAQGWLARQLSPATVSAGRRSSRLRPVEIAIENGPEPRATVMLIRGEDTPGFLYELCNALALSDVSIQQMQIHTAGRVVTDTLFVTTREGQKITQPRRLQELRAAVVLTKQFTHLLPTTSNPAAALLHFRSLLQDLFRQPRWLDQLASLQQPDVLSALVKMFGDSDFLWEDFLRLHHADLFPVLTSLEGLSDLHDRDWLLSALRRELSEATGLEARRDRLNAFKDREMFRIDMRHILGLQKKFGLFSQELTWLAEAVCQAAVELAEAELLPRFGRPLTDSGRDVRLSVCALGKCGGSELGFASDIELMFVYEAEGRTSGPERIANVDYFARLVDAVHKTIRARQQGIFELDLRLRPYGQAGPPAAALATFERYYHPDGPAWPYERQALVKLRPIAGDPAFGAEVTAARDRLVYSGRPFDLFAMRGMRERQLRELVRAGEFNAKLSPGGVVDCEYFVQALQMHFGHDRPELRATNTREALRALEAAGIVPDRSPLRDAYRFLRRLIDALRMVRGHARDLTVPRPDTAPFEFLARRLDYGAHPPQLQADLERHAAVVRDHMQRLEDFLKR